MIEYLKWIAKFQHKKGRTIKKRVLEDGFSDTVQLVAGKLKCKCCPGFFFPIHSFNSIVLIQL